MEKTFSHLTLNNSPSGPYINQVDIFWYFYPHLPLWTLLLNKAYVENGNLTKLKLDMSQNLPNVLVFGN